MKQLRIVDHALLTEREESLARLERDLVTTLGLLDDIRQDCEKANDRVGASFMAGVSETVIAFANMYFRNVQ